MEVTSAQGQRSGPRLLSAVVEAARRNAPTLRQQYEQANEPAPHRTDGRSTYITPAEASTQLRVTPGGVRRMVREGRLRGVKVGRLTRILRSDVERLLAEPNATPDVPAFDRAADLLSSLTSDERRRLAVLALSTPVTPSGEERR